MGATPGGRTDAGAGRLRRRLLGGRTVAAWGAGAGVLAACATSGPVGEGPAGRTPAPVTLRVMDRTGSEEEVYPQRIPVFEAANPSVKVAYDLSPEWGAPKITTLAAARGLPDLGHVLVNTQDFHAFFLQGVLLPVDDLRFLGRPDLPPGVQETARWAMDEAEPYGLAWNFRGNEVDRVLREGMDRLASGEQAPEAGVLQDLERRIQVVLDQPRAGA